MENIDPTAIELPADIPVFENDISLGKGYSSMVLTPDNLSSENLLSVGTSDAFDLQSGEDEF